MERNRANNPSHSLEDQIKIIVHECLDKRQRENPAPVPKRLSIHIKELSRLTGLSTRALKGRRDRGNIKLINAGKDLLIEHKEAQRFLKTLGLSLD